MTLILWYGLNIGDVYIKDISYAYNDAMPVVIGPYFEHNWLFFPVCGV